MQITNGTVERTYKPADYEGRRVSLSFNLDPGDDVNTTLAHVASLAEHHARVQPGPIQPAMPPASPVSQAAPSSALPVMPPTPPVTAGPGPSATTAASPSSPVPPPPPAPVAAPPAPVAPATSPAPPLGSSPNPASGIDPRLTDKALADACTAKINAAQDRQAMVNLVMPLRTKYTNNPALPVAAIPVEQRANFLAELAALRYSARSS